MLEGGRLHHAAWTAGVVDRVQMFVTPQTVAGADGVPWLGSSRIEVDDLTDVRTLRLGSDVMIEGMFTGLIEAVGEVTEVKPRPAARGSGSHRLARELANGDSLAVNGVCLTVVAADAGVHMDVSPETARIAPSGR